MIVIWTKQMGSVEKIIPPDNFYEANQLHLQLNKIGIKCLMLVSTAQIGELISPHLLKQKEKMGMIQ